MSNEDRDGLWFEGTAHMAVAYAVAGQDVAAEALRQQLILAQHTTPFGDNFGLAAGSHDGISTGFGFLLFRRLHVGATAWNVFAQLRFNPYYTTTLSTSTQLLTVMLAGTGSGTVTSNPTGINCGSTCSAAF